MGHGAFVQNCLQVLVCVRARLQSCRKWPIWIPALAAAKLQITEKKPQELKPNSILLLFWHD
jgi:hypothetical protein